MKDSYIRKCWFCIVTIFVLFLSVIFVEVYKALGTIIVLDSLDTGSTEYKVTKYSKYSVIEITEGGEYTLTQNDLDTVVNANIIVDSDEEVTLILDGINVKAGNYSQTSVFSSAVYGTAAISVQGDTDCKIVLKDDSVNTLTGYTDYEKYDEPVNNSFYHTAAISVENTIVNDEIRLASLTIEGENGAANTGILNANGGNQSAAIGAGINRLSGNITINSGIINAVSGDYGAAIGDGDTVQVGGDRYDEENGSFVWVVGETNSVATIEVNGGELWATATKDTPGIGTADNLITGYHAEVDVWTGLQININGGVVVAIGGVQAYNPSSAIGPGSNTFVSSNNIVINKGEGDAPTEIIAVTRTDYGSYPVSNSGGDAIPVLSADSTASVLNVKFSEPKIARQLDFWYYVDPTYKTDTTSDFPNALLDRMGDIEVLGLAVLLPEGKYKISQDIDNDGADENDPTLDEGLVVGGSGSITCDENYYGTIYCRYPLEIRSPSHLTVIHGDSAYFDVEVLQYSQDASLTYQWYVSTDAGSSWNLLDGANSERYDISEALISDSGNLYRCDVTENYYGENVVLSSLPAKLTVLREIEYEVDVNLLLDGSLYRDNNSSFELYDTNGTYIKDLELVDGVLNFAVTANTYRIYIDGEDVGIEFVIDADNTLYDINYYSVNLDVVSDNADDSVLINGTSYNSGNYSKALVLLSGNNINLSALAVGESEVSKFTINSSNVDIDNLVSGYDVTINSKTDIVVEFDYKKYDIDINVNLDNSVYTDVTGTFELKNDSTYSLNNTNGVLEGSVPAGTYVLYRDGEAIKDDIVITSSKLTSSVDYYSVNLEVASPNNSNTVLINENTYNNSVSKALIVLDGDIIMVEAHPASEMEVVKYTVNNVNDSIDDVLNYDAIMVNNTVNLYIEFDVIEYPINITAYLDSSVYTTINGVFELKDSDGNKITDLTNMSGILNGSVAAGNYVLYRDGKVINDSINVSSTNKEFRVDYYSVNLKLKNPNNKNYVIIDGINYYDNTADNQIVLLKNSEVSVKGVSYDEMEITKYTINEKDSVIEELINGVKVKVNDTKDIFIEFSIIEYPIKVNVYLDKEIYDNISGKFALYSGDTKVKELTNTNGVLSTDIPAGNYILYRDNKVIDNSIIVSDTNKEFRIDYYTVNLELVSPNDSDSVIIGDNTYVDSMNGEMVLLSGDSVSIKALPVSEMEIIKYTINDEDSDISKLLEGYNISVTEQTNIYVEFDIITYDISVTTYLDNSVYESIVGVFELKDSKGNKVSDLTNINGVLKANIAAGSYNIYIDGEDIGESIVVTSSNKDFRIDYYTVNLELVSPNSEDYVEINGACFKDSTTLNEIILLAGNDISLKGVPYEEMEVTKFTINEADSNINNLLNGYTININTKTDIYVRFDVIAYGIKINTYLDDSEYLDNSRVYSLYDNDGNLVDDMLNTSGVLTSDTEAGNYYLYENGINTNIKIDVTSDNKGFKVDYYTVNLELVSSNDNDSVIIGDNTYVDSMSGKIILLSGESINVKGVPDTEQEIIKYSINSNNGDINKLLGGTSIKVLEKTDIYVEFDIIEYLIKVNVYLDDAKYTDVSHDYSLYKDGTLFKELNNNDGILNTDVPAGSYTIYEDKHSTGKSIIVTRNDKVFNLNYYTVNLEVVSPNDNDYVKINDISYVDGTTEGEIVVLEGDTISIEAVPHNEMEVKEYLVNEKDNEIADLLAGYNITIEEKTNIYVEFEIIEYPIKINTFLDGNSYDNLEGIFKLYDENGNKVSNLTKTNGVLTASLAAGTYYVYDEGVKTNYSIVVTDNDREFNMYYYTVNLVIDSKNDLNSVVIDDITYYDKTKDNEIVVLYGDSVNVKALVGEEMEIYKYTINNNSSDISSLMSGYDLKINNTTNLYVKFDDYRYTSVFNVYIDDEVIEDLTLVPEISFVRDDIKYTKDSKFTNGLYEVILDGVSSDISINVNKGIVDVYFYNVSLVGDRGINATNGSGLYLKDTDVSIEATLNAGFNFEGWYFGEELLDNGLSYNIRNISKKHDLTAKTIALAPYEPVVTPVNGYYDYGSLDTKVLELDVTPYEGTSIVSYQWYKCDELECNNKNLIEGANSDIFNPEDVNVDLYGYYCEVVILREDNSETLTTGSVVRLGINPITPEISLDEKVEYFTGSEINIDDVLISNIVEADKFDVEYLYYLDEECTVLTNKANSGANVDGGAPVNVGSYYVKVTVSGNSNYNEVSSVSKVTILEVVVPPVEEDEDEKNPVTLDMIILVFVASILGIVLAIRCLPFVFKY